MTQAELERADDLLDSLHTKYEVAEGGGKPMTVPDAKRLQDYVDLMLTPE